MTARAALEALAAGQTVVTATRRLSRRLGRLWDAERRTAGDAVWPSADTLPLEAWLRREWQRRRDWRSGPVERLLSARQARYLWSRLLEAAPEWRSLLLPGQVAGEAARGYALMCAWDIRPEDIERDGSSDSRLFAELVRRFDAECLERGWLDVARLPERLRTGGDRNGAPTRLAGFDRRPPAIAALVDAMAQGGRDAAWAAGPSSPPCPAHRASFPDPVGELRHAAAWASDRLHRDAGARLAVIVPDLEERRSDVERIFDDALSPAALVSAAEATRPWSMSLGRPLADVPAIHAALVALGLSGPPRPWQQVGQLLRSPFLPEAASEGSARAALDVRLRERGVQSLDLARLRAWVGERSPRPLPALAQRLERLAQRVEAMPARADADSWAGHFQAALSALGWPGDGAPDSDTWQALEAWEQCLGELASLAALDVTMSRAEALGELAGMVRERIFQPERAETSVQVLGLLEASGLEFDGVWLTGAHDRALPLPLRPHPFLPARLQRRLAMPRSCPAAEAAWATSTVERLEHSAVELIVSWSRQVDEQDVGPSPAIRELPPFEPEAAGLVPAPGLARVVLGARRDETIVDDRLPVLPAAHSAGGTDVLKRQSDCPFQASAVHRLGCVPLETPRPGIDPRVRGTVTHRALEEIWREICTRDRLLEMAPETLRRLVVDAVEAASRPALAGPDAAHRAMAGLERERQVALILELLAVEAERPPFEVLGTEESGVLDIGPLRLRGRVDRRDRVESGVLLIDYKSGKAEEKHWFGERPEQPQLPAYGLASDEPVAGLAFGVLRAGEVRYRGKAREALFAGVSGPGRGMPSWDAQQASWRDALERLAAGFAAGEARVDPRDREVCRYCHLATLCRVNDMPGAGFGDDDE